MKRVWNWLTNLTSDEKMCYGASVIFALVAVALLVTGIVWGEWIMYALSVVIAALACLAWIEGHI